MRRERLRGRDLRSTLALPSAACVFTNSATTRLTLLGRSAFVRACALPECRRGDVRDGSKAEKLQKSICLPLCRQERTLPRRRRADGRAGGDGRGINASAKLSVASLWLLRDGAAVGGT